MIDYVLDILESNETLKSILKPTPKFPKFYLLSTNDISDCIVYTWGQVSSDGIIKEYRLKVTAITVDTEVGFEIMKVIDKELITVGDTSKHYKILQCNQNGEGLIEDHERGVVHTTRYYYIKSKY